MDDCSGLRLCHSISLAIMDLFNGSSACHQIIAWAPCRIDSIEEEIKERETEQPKLRTFPGSPLHVEQAHND
jgi:hypothetical protein